MGALSGGSRCANCATPSGGRLAIALYSALKLLRWPSFSNQVKMPSSSDASWTPHQLTRSFRGSGTLLFSASNESLLRWIRLPAAAIAQLLVSVFAGEGLTFSAGALAAVPFERRL